MAYTTIDDPSKYFTITLYTGSSNTGHEVTNDANAGDFKPDWLWIKNRSGTHGTRSHELMDSSRGANKALESDDSEAEFTRSGTNSFNTNGFTVGDDLGVNSSASPSVAWQWKANGGTTSSNTDGSITTTVQANTTAGFSIVTYTGNATDNATIGHGLGATPEWVIIKNRASSIDWAIGHKSIFGNNAENTRFNTGAAASADDAAGSHFSRNAPSSTVITLGDGGDGDFSTDTNRAETHVAYCFTSIKGYSKIGSYTGNGNADGPFLYLGFRPKFIIIKRTDTTGSWFLIDSVRDINTLGAANTKGSAEAQHQQLFADASDAESTYNSSAGDFLSNGYKLKGTNASTNANGGTFIYMAFAEHPFVSSKGVPVTAT